MSKKQINFTDFPKPLQDEIERNYGPTRGGFCDIARISNGYDMISKAMDAGDAEKAVLIGKAIGALSKHMEEKQEALAKLMGRYSSSRGLTVEEINTAYICQCARCGYDRTKQDYRMAMWRMLGANEDGETYLLELMKEERFDLAKHLFSDLIRSMKEHVRFLGPDETPEWQRFLGP